jgi:hypothetical protein
VCFALLAVPSCTTVRANVRQAHPLDQTKYYICRNQWKYEITTCPNGGLFDDRIKGCIDLCEQKKPCLNLGQCIIHTNLTLECVCRRDWTGDRCEIPLSTCAQQPCGPNAECHMLKASDYDQDYVCICNKHESYGRNCQQSKSREFAKEICVTMFFAFQRCRIRVSPGITVNSIRLHSVVELISTVIMISSSFNLAMVYSIGIKKTNVVIEPCRNSSNHPVRLVD